MEQPRRVETFGPAESGLPQKRGARNGRGRSTLVRAGSRFWWGRPSRMFYRVSEEPAVVSPSELVRPIDAPSVSLTDAAMFALGATSGG